MRERHCSDLGRTLTDGTIVSALPSLGQGRGAYLRCVPASGLASGPRRRPRCVPRARCRRAACGGSRAPRVQIKRPVYKSMGNTSSTPQAETPARQDCATESTCHVTSHKKYKKTTTHHGHMFLSRAFLTPTAISLVNAQYFGCEFKHHTRPAARPSWIFTRGAATNGGEGGWGGTSLSFFTMRAPACRAA